MLHEMVVYNDCAEEFFVCRILYYYASIYRLVNQIRWSLIQSIYEKRKCLHNQLSTIWFVNGTMTACEFTRCMKKTFSGFPDVFISHES